MGDRHDVLTQVRRAASPARRRQLRTKRPNAALPTDLPPEEMGPALLDRLGLPQTVDPLILIRAHARYHWLRVRFNTFDMSDARMYAWCVRLSRWRTGWDYTVWSRARCETDERHRRWGLWHEAGHIVYRHLKVGESSMRGGDMKAPNERAAEAFAQFMSLYTREDSLTASQASQPVDPAFRALYEEMGW